MDQPSTNLGLTISSPAFSDGGLIPAEYTCKDSNVNPPLFIKGIPETAKSLVLILHDPDAPGGDFVHWLVWNINPDTIEIPQGGLPVEAVEGTTSFGRTGYGGPCPPSGTHHYIFELYALDTKLDLDQNTNRDKLIQVMNGHILAKAKLTGLFSKN